MKAQDSNNQDRLSKVAQASPAYFWFLMLTAYCLLLTCYGCGYTIHGKTSLPFDSIQIGKIENKTFEPKLQDKLYKALTEEFLKQGVAVHQGAQYTISGVINLFELKILSEKGGTAVEYEVSMKGDFRLVEPSGQMKDFRGIGSPFIVSFQGSGSMEDVIALKERASEKAVRDMAMELVAILIYSK